MSCELAVLAEQDCGGGGIPCELNFPKVGIFLLPVPSRMGDFGVFLGGMEKGKPLPGL